jgi:hypothetical protein
MLRQHRSAAQHGMPMRAAIGEMARSYGPGTVEGAGDKGHQRFIVASDVCWK